MARRILSADSALVPHTQHSLTGSARTEPSTGRLAAIQARWVEPPPAGPEAALFDWERRDDLLAEIAFVNRAQEFLDEAAIKIAPSVLRIVLTVKHHIPDPREQRAFLADHLTLDFRRISELCIVAESYRLLDAGYRREGEAEIGRYGWSKAIKLAHVHDPAERRQVWETACAGGDSASYRAVLEAIRRFRERKLIPSSAPAPRAAEVTPALASARVAFTTLERTARHLRTRDDCRDALGELNRLRRELDQVRRAIEERLEAYPVEEMTEALAAEA